MIPPNVNSTCKFQNCAVAYHRLFICGRTQNTPNHQINQQFLKGKRTFGPSGLEGLLDLWTAGRLSCDPGDPCPGSRVCPEARSDPVS